MSNSRYNRPGVFALVVIIATMLLDGQGAATAGTMLQVAGVFRDYYDLHNGPSVLGAPLTGLTEASGFPAQYFEKGRLEDHSSETRDPKWSIQYGSLVAEMTACDPYGPVNGISLGYGEPTGRSYFVNTIQIWHDTRLRHIPPQGYTGGTISVPGGVFVPFDPLLRPARGYVVAQEFWDYIHRPDVSPAGWLHDIGLPMMDARDAWAFKCCEPQDTRHVEVRVQAFERAVLVYNPANDPQKRIERANIGSDAVRKLPQPRSSGFEVPAAGAKVTLPLRILARVGKPCQAVNVSVTWQDGTRMSKQTVLHKGEDWNGLLIDTFEWPHADKPAPQRTQGATLMIADMEGNSLGKQQITILGTDDPNTQEVTLFFFPQGVTDHLPDPVPVKRRIPRTERIGTAALEELLWGPAPHESDYATSIPLPLEILTNRNWTPTWGPRVKLLGLSIANGIATPNFSGEMGAYGGGSSRVTAITTQIHETLKQFPTIQSVEIAVEGDTGSALQP